MRAPRDTVRKARTLRRQLSLPEVLLWQLLRDNRLDGLRFPLGSYILDFFCAEARLAVEIDGSSHDHPDRAAHDARRDAWLASQGITVLRVAAAEVRDEGRRSDVLLTIAAAAAAAAPSTACGGPPPPLRG